MKISTTLFFETMPLLSLMHCPDFGDTLRLAAAAVVAESKDEGALMSGQSMRRWVCFELLRSGYCFAAYANGRFSERPTVHKVLKRLLLA
jgi:hypothetical protein